MSAASDFWNTAQKATVYEVIGKSGVTYVIFWFFDGSVCAAHRVTSKNKASARWEFGPIEQCLKDCGMADVVGNNEKGAWELLSKLQGR
ncbi:MAG: hypothetical protein WCI88_06015 [Chloroflexota bacterium]